LQGGSDQNGLSAAGGVYGFYGHCSAADKRYSLASMKTAHVAAIVCFGLAIACYVVASSGALEFPGASVDEESTSAEGNAG